MMLVLALSLLPIAVYAGTVRVFHNDTSRIEYFPQVCEGVGCGGNCNAWWVTGGDCWDGSETTHSCKNPEASLRFNFTGTTITWLAVSYDLGGRANVFLDDEQVASITTMAGTRTIGARIWSKSNLANAAHVLTIRYDESTFDATNNRYVQVYGFEYTEVDGANPTPSNTSTPTGITSTTAIAIGCGVGAGVALIVIGLVFWFLYRRKRAQHLSSPVQDGYEIPYVPHAPDQYQDFPDSHSQSASVGRSHIPDYVPTPFILPPPESGFPQSHPSPYPHSVYGGIVPVAAGDQKRRMASQAPESMVPSPVVSSLPAMTSATTLSSAGPPPGPLLHQPLPQRLAVETLGAQSALSSSSGQIQSPSATLPAYSEFGDPRRSAATNEAVPLLPSRMPEIYELR